MPLPLLASQGWKHRASSQCPVPAPSPHSAALSPLASPREAPHTSPSWKNQTPGSQSLGEGGCCWTTSQLGAFSTSASEPLTPQGGPWDRDSPRPFSTQVQQRRLSRDRQVGRMSVVSQWEPSHHPGAQGSSRHPSWERTAKRTGSEPRFQHTHMCACAPWPQQMLV